MTDSRFFPLLALLALPCVPPVQAQQDAPPAVEWTVTCSRQGSLVFRERMTEAQAVQRQPDIVRRYPGATCAFLATTGTEPDVYSMPVGTPYADDTLDAALRAILGDESPLPEGLPVPVAPPAELSTPADSLAPELPDISAPPDYQPSLPGWIRLAVYQTENIEDPIADWERLIAQQPALGRFTPSMMATDDGYILLSAGPVPDAETSAFCFAVQSAGMECELAALPAPDRPDGYDYLAYTFPMLFSTESQCRALPVLMHNPEAGFTCWRSPLDIPQPFPPSLTPAARDNQAIETGETMPPLPRPRPSRD